MAWEPGNKEFTKGFPPGGAPPAYLMIRCLNAECRRWKRQLANTGRRSVEKTVKRPTRRIAWHEIKIAEASRLAVPRVRWNERFERGKKPLAPHKRTWRRTHE